VTRPHKRLDGGEVLRVSGGELLRSARPLDDAASQLGRAFHLEVLPNRDSLPCADLLALDST